MISDAGKRYSRSDDVVVTEVNGVLVLLHVENWNYFEFNAVSTAIWSALETPASLDTIVDALERQFDVTRERCADDARQFLDELIAEGVVTHA